MFRSLFGGALKTALRVLAHILVRIPPPIIRWTGAWLGLLGFYLLPRRARIAAANLEWARSRLEIETSTQDLVREHFRHLGISLIQLFMLPALGDKRWRRAWIHYEGLEELHRARREDRGVLLLTSHHGIFEWITTLSLEGIELWGLYQHRNYLTVRILSFLRESTGTRMVSRDRGFRQALKGLRGGGVLGVVADQGQGESMDLLGLPVAVARGTFRLGSDRVAMFTASAVRCPDGRVTISVQPLDVTGSNRDGFAVELNRVIRGAPTQYYWVHDVWRRFKEPHLKQFALTRRWGGKFWVRDGYQGRFDGQGTSLQSSLAPRITGHLGGGRGACPVVDLGGGEEGVLRHCRRGGLFGPVLGDRYFGFRPRPLDELHVSEVLRQEGLLTPEILAVHVADIFPGAYRADVVTRRVPNSRDLGQFLQDNRGSRNLVLRLAGRLVRKLHEACLDHPDLNLRNILVQDSDDDGDDVPRLWILDLDLAVIRPDLKVAQRLTMLERLDRSYRKLHGKALESGHPMGLVREFDRTRFLEGYLGFGQDRLTGREVLAELRRRHPRHGRSET